MRLDRTEILFPTRCLAAQPPLAALHIRLQPHLLANKLLVISKKSACGGTVLFGLRDGLKQVFCPAWSCGRSGKPLSSDVEGVKLGLVPPQADK